MKQDPRLTPANWMPPTARMDMPVQDFGEPFIDPNAQGIVESPRQWAKRLAMVVPAFGTTAILLSIFAGWMKTDGFSAVELFWLALIGLTFFWISFVVSTTIGGLYHLLSTRKTAPAVPQEDLNVAILIPIYNESPRHVFGNLAAMIDEMMGADTGHSFDFFLLSDSQDPVIISQETLLMNNLRQSLPGDARVFYRRRKANTDRKTGNIGHWLTNWGSRYDAMLVLDADSVMDRAGILGLTDTLASDPCLGLVQSNTAIFGAQTLFGRLQQFASAAYGKLPANGLAFWSGPDANYIGHNAILRTAAFADCAGLPYLKGIGGKASLIMSHDFVEAALMRRAGWGVRIAPEITGSYEETPITLIDYILRDRRWCQGNMQHLRILTRARFHPISRYHMFHNALAYLMSPAWFALVAIWALLGTSQTPGLAQLLSGRPMPDIAPQQLLSSNTIFMLLFVYGMLLFPKFIGAALVLTTKTARDRFGGVGAFTASFWLELVASVAFAPIMMIQQTLAIVRSILGKHESWGVQKRYATHYSLASTIWFHRYELIVGTLLGAGMILGVTSLWLLPIAVSLLGAVPLSVLSGVPMESSRARHLLSSPLETDVPSVVTKALAQRRSAPIAPVLPPEHKIAAE